MEECTIGYFERDGKIYAGKNREPGKNILDVLKIKTKYVDEPKLMYIGMNPWEEPSLSGSINEAYRNNKILSLKDDLDINLHKLDAGDECPSKLQGKLSENIWGGIYPDKRVGMPTSSPVKAVYILPAKIDSNRDLTTITDTPFYNLDRSWGGINESGLFIQSSSIRLDGNLKEGPSYSYMTEEMLGNCESVKEAKQYLVERVKDFDLRPGNFLIADKDEQAIIEYLPGGVIENGDEPSVNITEDLEKDFRTNFARETDLGDQIGFYKRKGWNLNNYEDIYEVQNFIRSLNRQIASLEEADELGEEIFSSHSVYPDLYQNREVLEGMLNAMYKGKLLDMSLDQKEEYPSFYSICTHPAIEQISWLDEFTPVTHKRTQWSWTCDLETQKSTLKYDNSCSENEGGNTQIEINMEEVENSLKTIK